MARNLFSYRPFLGDDGRLSLLVQVADIHLDRERKKRVKGPNYEGRIVRNGGLKQLDTLHGYEYTCQLDINRRETPVTIKFLLSEIVDNFASPN